MLQTHPIKSSLSIVALTLYLISLAGCGGGDSEANDNTQNKTGNVDNIAPSVTITSPGSTDQMPYLLRGTASDNVAVTALSYQIGAATPQSIEPVTSPFSVELNLQEGQYLITVTAEDAAGNSQSADLSLTYSTGGGQPPAPSTSDLLGQAIVNGEITPETAKIYEIYALFGDGRLPTQYRGEDPTGLQDHALDELVSDYENLPEATKTILDPFLVPPYYAGSWWDQRTPSNVQINSVRTIAAASAPPCSPRNACNLDSARWAYVDTGNGKARVWYVSTDANGLAIANVLASEIDATIWPKLTTLLPGQEPRSDALDRNNGGDGRLDISLVDFADPNLSDGFNFTPNTYGFVQNYAPGCEKDSVYMVINSGKSMDEMLATLAHESMHAFQWSYDVAEFCLNRPENYKWLMEATATWAIDHIYPAVDIEQDHAKLNFFPVPELSLDNLSGNHEYGAYVFPFYLAKAYAPVWIRHIWEASKSVDELKVLEKGIAVASGGETNLKEQWAKFTINNWNRDPIDKYKNWDSLNDGAETMKGLIDGEPADLNGLSEGKIEFPVRLPHLSAQYARIIFPDQNVRTVAFYNGFTHKVSEQAVEFPINSKAYVAEKLPPEDREGAQVWALIKTGGSWSEPEDWTEQPFKAYCRDAADERIEELVLIFSNADIKNRNKYLEPQGDNPFLAYSNTGCWKWKGNVNFTDENDGVTTKLNVNATWEKVTPMVYSPPGIDASALTGTAYHLKSGNLSWKISGIDSSNCVHSGGIDTALGDPPVFTGAALNVYQNYNYVSGGEAYRGFILAGFINNFQPIKVTVTEKCPDATNTDEVAIYPMLGVLPTKPNGKVDFSGTNISGDENDALGGTDVTGSWSFTAEKEP